MSKRNVAPPSWYRDGMNELPDEDHRVIAFLEKCGPSSSLISISEEAAPNLSGTPQPAAAVVDDPLNFQNLTIVNRQELIEAYVQMSLSKTGWLTKSKAYEGAIVKIGVGPDGNWYGYSVADVPAPSNHVFGYVWDFMHPDRAAVNKYLDLAREEVEIVSPQCKVLYVCKKAIPPFLPRDIVCRWTFANLPGKCVLGKYFDRLCPSRLQLLSPANLSFPLTSCK